MWVAMPPLGRQNLSLESLELESKAGVCFIAFIANDFEEYLVQMQTNEPMVHIMYEKMSSLVFNLMKKNYHPKCFNNIC